MGFGKKAGLSIERRQPRVAHFFEFTAAGRSAADQSDQTTVRQWDLAIGIWRIEEQPMNNHFLLNFAPTGMIPTKDMTPMVPIRPVEIVEQVLEAADLGANMIHLHARDPIDGKPTYRKEIYAEIIAGIREKNRDLVLCVSTSGRDFPGFEERSQCLDLKAELKPDMGSLTLS